MTIIMPWEGVLDEEAGRSACGNRWEPRQL